MFVDRKRMMLQHALDYGERHNWTQEEMAKKIAAIASMEVTQDLWKVTPMELHQVRVSLHLACPKPC